MYAINFYRNNLILIIIMIFMANFEFLTLTWTNALPPYEGRDQLQDGKDRRDGSNDQGDRAGAEELQAEERVQVVLGGVCEAQHQEDGYRRPQQILHGPRFRHPQIPQGQDAGGQQHHQGDVEAGVY